MKHELMKLPFEMDALSPYMSKETLEFHHGKHHQTYINKLNDLITDTQYENMSLEAIIEKSQGPIFNNAAQVFNHDFFWHSLSPVTSCPSSELFEQIEKDFGSTERLKEAFLDAAIGLFGSGWVWLIFQNRRLEIVATSNAQTPIKDGIYPLLTCDVWEHAYYIDYRNARPLYLDGYWKLVNWDFVSNNFSQVK